MLSTALTLILAGAAFGAYLAFRHFTGKPPPTRLALIHGPIAYSGVLVLIYYLATVELSSLGVAATVIFTGGAMLGFMMFFGHKNGQSPKKVILIAHVAAGLTGMAILTRLMGVW